MTVSSSTNGADTPFADITHFRSLIGALQYLAITRPDIQFAVNRVAQRMHQPSEHDYHCLKRILRYIFGTLGRSLLIRPGDLELRGFSNSDRANDKNDRKSTSGFHVFLGPNLISWCTKKQPKKAGLEKCTSQPTPMAVSSSTNGADTPFADITHFRSLIGALHYLAIIRPDIQFAVNQVGQRMHQLSEHDYHCLKRILRYIFGTLSRGLLIRPGDLELRGFSDSDWANDKNDRKSTSGFLIFSGLNLISWCTKNNP
uniref:Reverse transcriptase Ty1/copia-type domain-containing protein n=1 Tax=Solanum lycopersicum TaxID=4081 RepID=A0A3Q7IGH1_SOLLC